MRYITLAALVLLAGAPARAAAQAGGLESRLYPPELVMRFGAQIGLTDAQRDTIREAIKAMQSDVVDLQWELEERGRVLDQLLEGTRVDVDAVLSQADRVLEIEWKVKKRHLAALLEIKNTLTAEQQQKLLLLKQKGPDALR